MSNNITVDIHEVEELLQTISGANLAKMQRKALRSGGKLIYDAARHNMQSLLPASTHTGGRAIRGGIRIDYSDRLLDAIRMRVNEDRDHTYYFMVHTLGTRKKTSKTFIARFFEGGTVPRVTKSGANRGAIRPLNFFQSAINTNETRSLDTVVSTFYKELEKIV